MSENTKNRPWWRVIIRTLMKLLVAVFGLLIVIILLLNIPAVQTYITTHISSYLEKKLETVVQVEAVKIELPKTVVLNGLYFEDQNKDTLLYLGNLEIDISLFGLLRNEVNAKNIHLEKLVSHVHRKGPENDFNFQFVIDAFASEDTLVLTKPIPEKEPEQWELSVGELSLEQITASYYDDVVGIDARLQLGELNIDVDKLNPVDLVFMVEDMAMKNTLGSVLMWEVESEKEETKEPFVTDTATADYHLPRIGLENLLFENVNLSYKHREWQYDFKADIGHLEFESEKVDLNEQQIKVNTLFFNESDLLASMPLSSGTPDSLRALDSTLVVESLSSIEIPNPFPDWDISVNELELDKINAKLDDVNSSASGEALDFVNLQVDDLGLELEDASVSSEGAAAKINKLSFTEQSGFTIKKMVCEVSASDQEARIDGLKIETPNSNLKIDASLSMTSINTLLQDPANTHIRLNLEKSNLGIKDVRYLLPSLAENEYIDKINKLSPVATVNVSGTLKDLQINMADFQVVQNTGLQLSGNLRNFVDFDNLSFDINLDTLYTDKYDLYSLLDSTFLDGFSIPESLGLNASAVGTPDLLTARVNGSTSIGDFNASAYYFDPGGPLRDTFNIDFNLIDFNLNHYIADTTLGLVNLNVEAWGSGVLSDSVSADVISHIQHPEFNEYIYEDMLLKATMRNQFFDVQLESPDPNAKISIDANADLSQEKYHLNLDLDIDVLNLYALNFESDKIAISTELNASANYLSLDDLDAEVSISRFDIFQNNDFVVFNSASITTLLTPDSSFLHIKSEPLNVNLESNISSIELEPVIQSAARKYLGLKDTVGLPPGKNLTFEFKFSRNETIGLPLFPEIKKLAVDKFSGRYNSDNNQLSVDLDISKLIYGNIKFDNIKVAMDGLEQNASIQAGFSQVSIDSIKADPFLAMAEIQNGEVFSELRFGASQDSLTFLIASQLEIEDEALKISIRPDGLIFDHQKWQVPEGNFLKITNESFFSENFNFSHEDQRLGVDINDQLADLEFDNFNIANLVCFLFYEKHHTLMDGGLNGKFSLPGKANNNHFMADLQFEELYVFDTLVGNVKIKADYAGGVLAMDISLFNEKNKMSLSGSIDQNSERYDLKGVIAFSDISRLERFSFGEVSQMSGAIIGDFTLNGNYDNPDLAGSVKFKNTNLNITKLNFQTTLKDELLSFDNKGVHFDDFTIIDAQKNKLNIDGSLLTKDYFDFAFDLNIHTDKFQPISSTKEDNSKFYGSLVMGTDLNIKGDMDLPDIEASLRIEKGTELTYVLPGSEIELITSEGTVNFINPNSGLDTLFTSEVENYFTDSIISKIKGLNLSANLQLDPKAKFTVVIDPTSGDYLTIGGKVTLNFSADQSGSQSVTGIFEVSEGLYQLSFYGLVKKTFTIKPGGTVAWSGRPMDANVNITAMHIVRTASTALVANESGSLSQAELNMFKTRLPYEVLLNIRGFLAEPKVSFNIELEDRYRVNYPMVASKLDRLNTPGMESELNKQVFALLVVGTFIADNPLSSTSSSSENIATTAARNSVNGILADQLNNISNQYIMYVDLNFGLTTFDDYSSGTGETRTEMDVQVSKKFIDDRLEIEATGTFDLEGDNNNYTGTTSQHMYGEFSVTYDLNEKREYKLRAFRENAYDIFDGDVAYSGFSLIFEKSFDRIRKKDKQKKSKNKKKGNKESTLEEENREIENE